MFSKSPDVPRHHCSPKPNLKPHRGTWGWPPVNLMNSFEAYKSRQSFTWNTNEAPQGPHDCSTVEAPQEALQDRAKRGGVQVRTNSSDTQNFVTGQRESVSLLSPQTERSQSPSPIICTFYRGTITRFYTKKYQEPGAETPLASIPTGLFMCESHWQQVFGGVA